METLLVKPVKTAICSVSFTNDSVAGLEKSMNITPRVAEGADDELVFCEKSEFSHYTDFDSFPPKYLFNQVRRS